MDTPELTLEQRIEKAGEELTAVMDKYGLGLTFETRYRLVEVPKAPVLETPEG